MAGNKGRGPIATAPKKPAPAPSAPKGGGSSGSSGGGSGGSGGSGGGGGGGSDPYSKYQKQAIARENKAKRKAGQRYIKQAANLDVQARALKLALKQYKKNLRQNLSDVGDVLKDKQALVREGYRERVGALEGAVGDNENAAGGQSALNMSNAARERTSALSEIAAQGGGETDALRAQMMSLRNWSANQNEVNRGYFDTLRSTNNSLTDLTTDTKTALANNQIQANADREQLWTNYFDRRAESLIQRGNIRGQQADYFAQAEEMGVHGIGGKGGKKGKGKKGNKGNQGNLGKMSVKNQKQANRQAERDFRAAARTAGRSYDNPGVRDRIMDWEGRDEFESMIPKPNNSTFNLEAPKKPEGATLRKW